jgi:putative endonuclease
MNGHPRWQLYVLRCADGTLYTGITTDLDRRVREHQDGCGARYTRGRRPVVCIGTWSYPDRARAAHAEYAFKQLRRSPRQCGHSTRQA